MHFLAPNNSFSRAVASRPRVSGEMFAYSLESAKNVLSGRLYMCTALSFEEMVIVQRIGEALLEGDLVKLQRALISLECHGNWDNIEAALCFVLAADGIEILPLQRIGWRFVQRRKPADAAVFSILLVREHRVLVLSSEEKFGVHVLLRHGADVSELQENAGALLRQTGQRLSLELGGYRPHH